MKRVLPGVALATLMAACVTEGPQRADGEFKGLVTAGYVVSDLAAAKEWYTAVLGYPPYFDEPFYVGFRVGDFELGLDPDTTHRRPGAAGVIAYWRVADARRSFDRLVDLGAVPFEDVADVGGGVWVGVVNDPFGNLFGIIQMPH